MGKSTHFSEKKFAKISNSHIDHLFYLFDYYIIYFDS